MQRQVCRLRALLNGTAANSLSGVPLPSHRRTAAVTSSCSHAHLAAAAAARQGGASCSSVAGPWRAFGSSAIAMRASDDDDGGSQAANATASGHGNCVDPATNPPARQGVGGSTPLKAAGALLGQLSAQEQRQLRVLQCEYDALVASGIRMPSHVTDEQWLHCLRERLTRSSRTKYYKFLAVREHHAERRQQLKKQRQQTQQVAEQKQLETRQKELIPGTPYYAAPRNEIFHRIYPRVFKQLDNYRVAYAMQFGQPVIVDMGFGSEMSPKEHAALHTELLFLIGLNRTMREPFHLHLCNINFDDLSLRIFDKALNVEQSGNGSGEEDDDTTDSGILPPAAHDGRKGWWADQFLMTTTDKCYTELFPKQKLVYLTPNATEIMKAFDPDAIYIVGGLVDLGPQGPLSLAKAKKQDIRAMKLPLDYYVKWKLGKKSLGINHVFGILKELKETGGDWRRAIELHAPHRKLDLSTPPAAEADDKQPANAALAARSSAKKWVQQQHRHSDQDRLSFYRTSSGKQYGHLQKNINAGYKHYKKPPSQA